MPEVAAAIRVFGLALTTECFAIVLGLLAVFCALKDVAKAIRERAEEDQKEKGGEG